jgi:ABC-type glycerol-3-phosphate transport system substrate-binding protein
LDELRYQEEELRSLFERPLKIGPWLRRALILAISVTFAACGGSSAAGSDESFHVHVAGNTMAPSTLTAHQNDKITLTVTADRKEEIHLHGYDYKFEIDRPNGSVTKTFTAANTGSFEIEIEDTSTHLGELNVYPR